MSRLIIIVQGWLRDLFDLINVSLINQKFFCDDLWIEEAEPKIQELQEHWKSLW